MSSATEGLDAYQELIEKFDFNSDGVFDSRDIDYKQRLVPLTMGELNIKDVNNDKELSVGDINATKETKANEDKNLTDAQNAATQDKSDLKNAKDELKAAVENKNAAQTGFDNAKNALDTAKQELTQAKKDYKNIK